VELTVLAGSYQLHFAFVVGSLPLNIQNQIATFASSMFTFSFYTLIIVDRSCGIGRRGNWRKDQF
jgi:hypothetical protein